ncbi:OmpL47-type beta-barrel domain-containing protein [Micromonospora sp. CA-263727]|uniref:OmpL47-type beta-barrel domain-containing protein n=1 Tax=Micromonospora sp. CA-263727 TaxID=3239967 RepID=UPI003D93D8DF
MIRRLTASLAALLLAALPLAGAPATAAPPAATQVLTWTADGDINRYLSAPVQAVAGQATIIWENSTATGNNTGMPHTLTFDTTTEGYNHDVTLNILASPFDANDGRHEATVTLTPGRYRYFCAIPGHGEMVGELVVTAGGDEDTTPPEVSATVAGDRDPDGNYLGAATVTVTATDAGSGVESIEYQLDDTGFRPYGTPVQVTAIGEHSVRFRATDRAGNTSAVGSVSFRIVEPDEDEDTTAPTVTADIAGPRDAAGNYLGTATATLTATDTQSGVATIEYALDGAAFVPYTAPIVVDEPGMHMLHYRATDVAGNTSAEQMAHFTVVAVPAEDTTPPVASATVTGEQDDSGAYVGSATVTVTATDDESGVASIEYAVDTGDWTGYTAPVTVRAPGPHTLRYRATDVAGNTSAERSTTFTVVADGTDACPDSDTRATVIINGDDTGVANVDTGNGCTINDLIDEHANYPRHADFVRHVTAVTAALVADGTLTQRQQGAIVRAAARSDIGA